jgi:hypothetical protein
MGFYAAKPKNCETNTSTVGIHLSPDSFFVSDDNLISLEPTYSNDSSNYINSKTEWTLVTDTFVAQGNEKWLTIGNFKTDGLTDIIKDSLCANFGYYCWTFIYIDDVFLEPLDETGIPYSPFGSVGVGLLPNPNNGNFTITVSNNETSTLEISTLTGQVVLKDNFKNSKQIEALNELAKGIYLCKVMQGGSIVYQGKMVVQ